MKIHSHHLRSMARNIGRHHCIRRLQPRRPLARASEAERDPHRGTVPSRAPLKQRWLPPPKGPRHCSAPAFLPSVLFFSSEAGVGAGEATFPRSWNDRVGDFLEGTATSPSAPASAAASAGGGSESESKSKSKSNSESPGQSQPQAHPRLTPSAAAETIQALLEDLLRITAAASGIPHDAGRGDPSEPHDFGGLAETEPSGGGDRGQYLDWRTTECLLPPQNATPEGNRPEDETIDMGLAFALMDRILALERDEDSALLNHTVQWTAHTGCLNPVLQLWKQAYSPGGSRSNAVGAGGATPSAESSGSKTPTPPEVLAKLDAYRQHSNVLVPDVQSYNTILDAVATHNYNPNGTKFAANRRNRFSNAEKHRERTKTASVPVDLGFCQSLWKWMWNEAGRDSLVRPDEVTLRIMLKANVLTGHQLAPQRCEALVDEWANHQAGPQSGSVRTNNNNSSSSSSPLEGNHEARIHDPRGTLLQSLIHVWALHDPRIAESYLNELARRYLRGESSLPPDAIAWNRVISAYAIAHGQPEKGLEVLEEFWSFYRTAHGLDSGAALASNPNADAPDSPGDAADSKTINTKSNSLKLLNATVVARKKEEWGPAGVASLGIDGARRKVQQPSLGAYNALLEGFARQHNASRANKILEQLQGAASVSPNIATYTSAIKANGSDLQKAKALADECLAAYKTQEREREEASEELQEDRPEELRLDRPFFHAWLGACAAAQDIGEARKVLHKMKSLGFAPNATTYRMLIDVFLARGDSQGAIEWLLAYAKLEGMSESAIVSCTTTLLDWYQHQHQENKDGGGDVDSMVLLQILCESDFVTQEESLQQLLLGISADQGTAVMGWLREKKDRVSLKMWAIVMRALAQEASEARDAEDFFLLLQKEPVWKDKFDPSSPLVFGDEEEKLIVEMYSSIIVAWCKHRQINKRVKQRIRYWTEELEKLRDGALFPNLAAQVALIAMYCKTGDPLSAEKYVKGLYAAHEEGRLASPPDTITCNMVLNAWAQKGNGLRAEAFFGDRVSDPDAVSYNTVVNAYARQGQLDKAEEWACKLVASFLEHPVESRRPQQATFTVLLAAWRRSRHPQAAERAEKILAQMNQLYDSDVLLGKPNAKSYQTVLDAWGKSRRRDAAQNAEKLVLSSDYKTNKKLLKKISDIKSRQRKLQRKGQKITDSVDVPHK